MIVDLAVQLATDVDLSGGEPQETSLSAPLERQVGPDELPGRECRRLPPFKNGVDYVWSQEREPELLGDIALASPFDIRQISYRCNLALDKKIEPMMSARDGRNEVGVNKILWLVPAAQDEFQFSTTAS